MEKSFNAPRALTLSTRLYRVLLTVYPSEFRQEYAGPMLQVFRDCTRRVLRESGTAGLLPLWSRTMLDVVQSALEEHAQRGVDMSREKFFKLSGWGMVLAAVFLLLTFLSETQIQGGLYWVFGAPKTTNEYAQFESLSNFVSKVPFFFATLLITLGLAGLYTRYGGQASQSARIALGIGILGGAAGCASLIVMGLGVEIGRMQMNLSIAVMFVGLFGFGLSSLRNKTMPRGNALPALASFWFPTIVMNAYLYRLITGHWGPEVPFWLSFAIFSCMAFFLALLGLVLQADAPHRKGSTPLRT